MRVYRLLEGGKKEYFLAPGFILPLFYRTTLARERARTSPVPS